MICTFCITTAKLSSLLKHHKFSYKTCFILLRFTMLYTGLWDCSRFLQIKSHIYTYKGPEINSNELDILVWWNVIMRIVNTIQWMVHLVS